MTKKVKISRLINRLGGGEDELYCSRIYRLSRCDPYGWRETEFVINLIFYIIRGEKNHVEKSARWEEIERKRYASKKKSEQSADEEKEK